MHTEEEPKYAASYIEDEILPNHEPKRAPAKGTKEYEAVLAFAKEVSIVIQSCNQNEYYAALELIKPPVFNTKPALERAIRYPGTSMFITVGTFAGLKAAIVWTDQGSSCQMALRKILKEFFPNTKAILGLGVAFGMDRNYRFGDVLVAQQVTDYGERPRIEKKTIVPRGQTLNTDETLKDIFCRNSVGWKFQCTKGVQGRRAKPVIGQLVSSPILLDDDEFKEGIKEQNPTAKGGEMEGWVLYTHIQKEFPTVHAIVIKGVADYADGRKDKRWQLTAAMAAVHYAHFQLERNGSCLDNIQ